MADGENLLKALRCIANLETELVEDCRKHGCPYAGKGDCERMAAEDALKEIGEQRTMLDAALRFLTEDISSESMCEYMSCDSGDSWCEENCAFSSPQRECWERFLKLGGMPYGSDTCNG